MTYDEEIPLTDYILNEPYGKSVGAVHRGLEIFELFSVEQCSLTVGEISEKLGYPQSSTSVLLHGLHKLGYLAYDRYNRTFYPTVRVSFLGMWMYHRIFNDGSLLKLMEDLASASGHVVLLAIQNGLYAQYMHIVSARTSRVGLKPGLMRPICRAAVGKVLLTLNEDEEIRRIVRNVNIMDNTFAEPVDPDILLEEIYECRRTGFAYSRSSVTSGSSVIATQLPLNVAGVPLAIGIGVHSSEFEDVKCRIQSLLTSSLAQHFNSSVVSANMTSSWIPPTQSHYRVPKKQD
ncbi:helix-turn-helix domain-containing protein [Advenella sp. WQ 585]|uniref:Helix-turn-helix domain-containing protein n=1 Tax=Advenella mandrilli TaxID=2800330 RepID=A0ABS1EHG9_9BURK|nr:helix-turn-helix domain-containing protein [Advenella mandrilli]MBK1782472.1 helix-turn-helix domain-containing protein [Advenella mandrilli]